MIGYENRVADYHYSVYQEHMIIYGWQDICNMFDGLYHFFQSTTPLRGEHTEVGCFYLVHFHYTKELFVSYRY